MARKATGLLYEIHFFRTTTNRADESFLQSTLDHSIWFYAYVTSLTFFFFRSPLIPSPSDEFDCSNWLLFEVRTHCGNGATALTLETDSGSSSRFGEGPGSS